MKLKVYRLGIPLVIGMLLTACGIKGPLYIPEKQYPPKSDGNAPVKAPSPKKPADDVYPN